MADTPFGTSFGNYGDPRKYMGQGQMPAQKIADKIKKIQASPLANVLGIMFAGDNEKTSPDGSVPSPVSGQAPIAPSAPTVEASPVAPSIVTPQPAATPAQGVDADGDGVVDNFWGVPTNAKPVVNLRNPTDFNPTTQQAGYNQMLNTGNEYKQMPGYGKVAKTLQTMFGMG
jgi:hypothetical protein